MNQINKISSNELSRMTGISKQGIFKEAALQNWDYEVVGKNGGKTKYFYISSLPPEKQIAIVKKMDITSLDLSTLCVEASLAALRKLNFSEENISSLNLKSTDHNSLEGIIWNEEVALKERIIQEALNPPHDYKKRDWVDVIAHKYNISRATIYRYINKFKERGLAGLKHTKSNKGEPRAWTPEALKFWLGLNLKRSHRKVSKKALYKALKNEAEKRGWNIGSQKNAYWHLKERINPQLLALQNGGSRELDNILPPILRDYSDLQPFEILVGDQHRFDFWVLDEETGELFRPECYMWQDLRTRTIYGGALAKKYDSQLMGLALRIGVKFFGLFQGIYTDNGKPEQSFYIESIIKEINQGCIAQIDTVDTPVDLSGIHHEDINCHAKVSGRHTKAIVRNAKAKMIEGTFNVLEGILRDIFLLPGYVKSLKDQKERHEVDEKEVKRLAESGRLTTWREFVIAFYNALAYYNNKKFHRGVLREWKWKPAPKKATPMDCLNMCIDEGWQPTKLSNEAIDLLFLARERRPRVVDRGRVLFNNKVYEHTKLIPLHKEKVYLRFDPFDLEWILVFYKGQYLCRAEPVEYSSMKDKTLAQRKIHEKARLRKEFVDQYRELTSCVSDIRQFSRMPEIENTASLVVKDKKQKTLKDKEFYRVRTQEELNAEISAIESYKDKPKMLFINEVDRFKWCVDELAMGKELSHEDQAFYKAYRNNMDPATKEYWELYQKCIEPVDKGGGQHEACFCS